MFGRFPSTAEARAPGIDGPEANCYQHRQEPCGTTIPPDPGSSPVEWLLVHEASS